MTYTLTAEDGPELARFDAADYARPAMALKQAAATAAHLALGGQVVILRAEDGSIPERRYARPQVLRNRSRPYRVRLECGHWGWPKPVGARCRECYYRRAS